jgi:hypothetical protein
VSAKPASAYHPVAHSHVVPAGYLRAWADGKQIAMRRAGTPESRLIGVKAAGVRRNFYRRQRPKTGETIYDIEHSLSTAESVALPVIADIRVRWPLTPEDKGKLAQFLALQHLRGEAFRRWHGRRIASILDAARVHPEELLTVDGARYPAETLDRLTHAMTSDTYRLTQMVKIVRSVATVLSSMHWSLVEFAPGALVTSDHPVITWPLPGPTRRAPAANDLSFGALNTLEVFAPLSPDLVVLMSWRDRQSPLRPRAGAAHHAATVNAFVIANAADQWFHQPAGVPTVARGPRPALSRELVDGYDAAEASSSRRRALARELANAETARPIGNQALEVVAEDRMPTY